MRRCLEQIRSYLQSSPAMPIASPTSPSLQRRGNQPPPRRSGGRLIHLQEQRRAVKFFARESTGDVEGYEESRWQAGNCRAGVKGSRRGTLEHHSLLGESESRREVERLERSPSVFTGTRGALASVGVLWVPRGFCAVLGYRPLGRGWWFSGRWLRMLGTFSYQPPERLPRWGAVPRPPGPAKDAQPEGEPPLIVLALLSCVF
jgi:hypothetical protein